MKHTEFKMLDKFVKIHGVNININEISGYGLTGGKLSIYLKGDSRPVDFESSIETSNKCLTALDRIFNSTNLVSI
jgi:hypothetical protein